ncbi:MAG TPA: hypothetical protein VEH62_06675 [Gemmatimonadales bacterium]|nr:hypothetical protein [Gemmatimonadales bacterium]
MTRRVPASLALAAALAAAAVPRAQAQANGTTSGAVLAIPATTRALGLGGAYTAVIGDVGSLFVNPAGLAPIRTVALGMSYQRYLMGSYLVSGGAAFGLGQFVVGVGANLLDFGQDTVYRPDPAFGGDRGIADPTGAMAGAYSAEATGSVAYRLGMFAVGVSAKWLQEHVSIPDTSLYNASGLGVDAGADLAFFDIAAIGVVVQNIGGDLTTSTRTGAPLPRTVRAGFSLNVVDPQGTPRLLLVGDWVSPRGASSYWAFGVEAGVVADGIGLLGRAGIATGQAPTDQRSLVFGGTLVFHNLQLDYGYEGFSSLGGGTSRFGVRWSP